MVGKSDVLKQLDTVTDKLSTQVRAVALGILALTWGLLIGESEVAKSLSKQLKWHFVGIGALAIATMFLDFLQYVMAYLNSRSLLKAMEGGKTEQGEYDYSSWSYKFRLGFFYGKQILLALTVLWLLIVLGRWMWSSR